MLKHDRQGHLRPLTDAGSSSSRRSVWAGRTTHIPAPAEAGSSTPLKKSFWTTPGMATLIDWMSDPHNYQRLQNKDPALGQKAMAIRKEIAKYVKDARPEEDINWKDYQIKSKIQYIRKKYQAAKDLSSTIEGFLGPEESDALLARQLKICPPFERFESAENSIPLVNSLAFQQTLDIDNDSDEFTDDLSSIGDAEVYGDIARNTERFEDLQTDDRRGATSYKRRKSNSVGGVATVAASVHKMMDMTDRLLRGQDEHRNGIREREQAIERREKDFVANMMRIEADSRRNLENELAAKRKRFSEEMAEEKLEFKAEMSEERALLKQERRELESKRVEYYDTLRKVATLQKELELRSFLIPRKDI
ncbi:hypothetical protein BGZ99_001481 [Dissophora globulifera]|uniref:Uncharacterized protein n=1 Tax=Dissophora globulifera TaxID=979702 RepID=A0A9P6RRG0_9FUNG|nr:hypothetical protein BGZ99_001481 [Dissophora globulifera]